jgi:hypothetical protein
VRRQPERAAQRAIVQLLSQVGCRVWVLGTTRPRGDFRGTCQSPGLPDLIAHLPGGGGVLFVEVKAGKNTLRPEQRDFRQLCLLCAAPFGVHHIVGGLDNVIAYLVKLGLLKADQVASYRVTMPEMQP